MSSRLPKLAAVAIFPEESRPAVDCALLRSVRHLALIEAEPDGNVVFATEPALRLIHKHWSESQWTSLPATLLEKLRAHHTPGGIPSYGRHYWQGLTARFLGQEEGFLQILLELAWNNSNPESLIHLGLTPRQAEVLFWIAQGKTNPEIAAILQCRSATVSKHIEHIFAKLCVETRSAATALVVEWLHW